MLFIIITLSLLWFIHMVEVDNNDNDTDLQDENLF